MLLTAYRNYRPPGLDHTVRAWAEHNSQAIATPFRILVFIPYFLKPAMRVMGRLRSPPTFANQTRPSITLMSRLWRWGMTHNVPRAHAGPRRVYQ